MDTEIADPADGYDRLDNTASCDFGEVSLDESGSGDRWHGRTLQGGALARKIRDAASSKKPVIIIGARIEGDIALAYAELNGVRFAHCLILGTIDVQGSTVDFLDLSYSRLVPSRRDDGHALAINGAGVHVKNELRLVGTHAQGELFLPAAQVDGCFQANELQCEVTEPPTNSVGSDGDPGGHDTWALDLTNATLKHDLDLGKANFEGGLLMAGCEIGGQFGAPDVKITALDPTDKRSFKRFALWAQRATITESALLRQTEVQPGANFCGVVSFHGATVGGNLDLTRAFLERGAGAAGLVGSQNVVLDLHGVHADTLVLHQVTVGSGEVSLKDAHVTRLSDDPGSWRAGRYSLNGFTYDNLDTDYPDGQGRTDWTTNQRRDWLKHGMDSDVPGPYLALADAYEKLGDPSNQRKALIQASSKAATTSEKVGLGWVRYGYRPWLVVVPMLALILVTVPFFAAAKHTTQGIVEARASDPPVAVADCDNIKVACPDTLAYAVDAVIPVDLGQTTAWRPNDAIPAGSRLAWMLRVDYVLSWLLAGVLVASVAGMLKRT